MPICLTTKSRFRLSLASDADTPEDRRPHFTFRPRSGLDWLHQQDLCAAINKTSTDAAALPVVYQIAAISLVSWGNMVDNTKQSPVEIPFDPAWDEPARAKALAAILTLAEADELLTQLHEHDKVSADEKKVSASQPPSGSGESVEAPVPGGQDRNA